MRSTVVAAFVVLAVTRVYAQDKSPPPPPEMKQTVDATRGMLKNAKDVPGVGRMAVAGDMGLKMMVIWDDDTNCIITATGSDADPTELGKALTADLTPASLK